MCILQRRILSGTFSTGTGNAGRADRGGISADRSSSYSFRREENKGKIAYFGGIQKCRFKGKVVPGDKVRLETRIIRQKGPLGVGEAVASVDGKVVVSAELTFVVGQNND